MEKEIRKEIKRLKENIVNAPSALSKINSVQIRSFDWKETGNHVDFGVIAQELKEVCGDCVKTESTGVMSVNSDNLTWHMINAIKDLKALVDAQATEITALKSKVGI